MPRRAIRLSLVVALIAVSLPAFGAGAEPISEPHFQRTWARTDQPVAAGRVNRTWMWGPEGHTGTLTEEYADAPGGERLVQYTDKSRMEDNSYRADAPWDVTNGHLAKELMTGRLQLGDDRYEQHQPADVQVAGDQNTDSPTYAMLGDLMDEPALDEGDNIVHEVLSDGTVTDNEVNYNNPADRLSATRRPYAAHYVEETDHTIASVFWDFMNSSGEVYEGGSYRNAQLFENPFFATGYPLTEAYWLNVLVAGAGEDVLAQCFERRCLTYNPDNPEGWQVEAGNIGQHYYEWRYNQIGEGGGDQNGDGGGGEADQRDPSDLALTSDSSSPVSVDDTVDLTATVEDDQGDPVSGVEVVFESDRQGQIDAVETDGSGQATVPDHRHQTAESETITATEQANGNQDSEALTWNPGDPDALTLERFNNPSGEFTLVGELRGVLATVTDQYGNRLEGVSVTFAISGQTGSPATGNHWTWYPDNGSIDQSSQQINSTERETNQNGVVGFDYRSHDNGRDQIFAEVTSDATIQDVHRELWCNAIVNNGEHIQAALDSIGSNEYVCVRPGTYPELIQIDTHNAFLVGSGVGDSVINAPLPGGQSPEPAIRISDHDALISGFTVTQAGEQEHPVVGIDGGMKYTQLFDLHISAPAYDVSDAATHPNPSHVVGHRDFNQPIGGITVADVTADRAIGLRLTDGATARIQRNTVTASRAAGIWIDWDGSGGSSKITENTYEGSYSAEQIILHDSPSELNNASSPSDQEAAENLVCENDIDGVGVNGTSVYACP